MANATSDLDRIQAELDASSERVRAMLAAAEAYFAALQSNPTSTVQCGGNR